MVHAVPKQVTTNPLISTGHWLHRWQVYSPVQNVSPILWCFQDNPRTTRLPNSLHSAAWSHKIFYSLKISALSSCPCTIYMCPHWELSVESIPRNDRFFYRGKGSCRTAPLFQPHEAGCTMGYMKGYEEGDSDTAASPNCAMTLGVAKVITTISKVQCSDKVCRTINPGNKWATGI